jgi:thiol:disulfide interchange protein DsbA
MIQGSDRRRLLVAGALLPVLAPHAARAQGRAPAQGSEFRPVNPPQAVESGNKIEVLEFFQYSCPHCYAFNPDLEAWRKRLPADVEYRRVHVNWDNGTLAHTKAYCALEQLGRVSDVHDKIFAAIHQNKRRLLDPNEIADLVAANGIDRKQWLDLFNSFSVATRANKSMQTWRAYKIDGTPALAVEGKWVTAPSMVGTREGALAVMDFLIQRGRAERGGGAGTAAKKK